MYFAWNADRFLIPKVLNPLVRLQRYEQPKSVCREFALKIELKIISTSALRHLTQMTEFSGILNLEWQH